MSSQERVDIQARNGRSDSVATRASVARLGSERLPRPPGRRRPGLAVIAVLLIVLGAAVAGLLATRIDSRVPVLVASREIDIGHQITSADLAVADIASSGIAVIPASQASQVIGRYASTPIPGGRLMDSSMLSTSSLLTPGSAAVGVSLQAGRYPASGLKSGDVVELVKSVEGSGKVIAAQATVGTVETSGGGVFGSSGGSNTTVVTVIVPLNEAAAVAAASTAQQISVVLLQRGGTVGAG